MRNLLDGTVQLLKQKGAFTNTELARAVRRVKKLAKT